MSFMGTRTKESLIPAVIYILLTSVSFLTILQMVANNQYLLALAFCFFGLFLYGLESFRTNGLKSFLDSAIMEIVTNGKLLMSKTDFILVFITTFFLLLLDGYGAFHTAQSLKDTTLEYRVEHSKEYQLVQKEAESDKEEILTYQKAMEGYALAKTQHVEECNQIWGAKFKTKLQHCIESFELTPPKANNFNMGSDISLDKYSIIKQDFQKQTSWFSWITIIIFIGLNSVLQYFMLYPYFKKYLLIISNIELDRNYKEALKDEVLKEIEAEAFEKKEMTGVNCEYRKVLAQLDCAKKRVQIEQKRAEVDQVVSHVFKPKVQEPKETPLPTQKLDEIQKSLLRSLESGFNGLAQSDKSDDEVYKAQDELLRSSELNQFLKQNYKTEMSQRAIEEKRKEILAYLRAKNEVKSSPKGGLEWVRDG